MEIPEQRDLPRDFSQFLPTCLSFVLKELKVWNKNIRPNAHLGAAPCSNIKIKSINEYLLNSHFQYYFVICSDNFSLLNPTRKWTLFLNSKQEEKKQYIA